MKSTKKRLLWVGVGLVLVLAGAVGWGEEQAAQTPPAPAVVAHFHLAGELTESPMADAFGLLGGQVTSLKDLVRRIDRAGTDDKVKAVILTYDGLEVGFAQLEEVRHAIGRVKDAGKKVYVHTEALTTFPYALLCAGSRVSVAPQSTLWLTGFYAQSIYLKDLLDKIGVQADFLHMGAYKSAAEMLTQTSPSAPAQENLNWLLDSWYNTLVDMIAQSRGKTPEQVRDLIDHGPYLAEQAREKGLIDAVATQEEFLAGIEKDLGGTVTIDNRYGQAKHEEINLASPLALFSILSELFKTPTAAPKKEAVGLIYVDGTILPGYGQSSFLGISGGAFSGDIRKALETAVGDDTVKAVVMRIDSPGGSAEASEVILNATRRLRGKKPFIVSMGNVAGSGGYYVAVAADTIFADEATITASIGVVGGKLVTKGLWDKLGVNWVGYKRGANADLLAGHQAFTEGQRKVIEEYMQHVYTVFKGHVTKERGSKLRKPIDELAGGRVYTGKQGLDLGLVDQLGGLDKALRYAAGKASLQEGQYEVRIIPKPKDFLTQLLEEYSGEGERPSDLTMPASARLLAGQSALASLSSVAGILPALQGRPWSGGPLGTALGTIEPQEVRVLLQALQRIDLLRRESVILMMPFDMIVQ
jgi:protease-4